MVFIVCVLLGIVVWLIARKPATAAVVTARPQPAAAPAPAPATHEFDGNFDETLARVRTLRAEAALWIDSDQPKAKKALMEALLHAGNCCGHAALEIADVFQNHAGQKYASDALDSELQNAFAATLEFDKLVFLALAWSDGSVKPHAPPDGDVVHEQIKSDVDALGMDALGKHISEVVRVTKDMIETMKAVGRAQATGDFRLVLYGVYGKTDGWMHAQALALAMFDYGAYMAAEKKSHQV